MNKKDSKWNKKDKGMDGKYSRTMLRAFRKNI